jgi:DNA-binding LytR/AlgR family response regulator
MVYYIVGDKSIRGNTMNVIVKDDNQVHQNLIQDMLIQMKLMMNIDFNIYITENQEEIIQMNKTSNNTINIIDIIDENDPRTTGVDLALDIREVNPLSPIIFLTSHDRYLQEAVNLQIRPHAYINKLDPDMEIKLHSAFAKIMHEQTKSKQDVRLSFTNENGDTIYILLSDIFMIYTSIDKQKYLNIETYDQCYTVKGLLHQYANNYPHIIQANKSTLVNKNKIQKITKSDNPKNKEIWMDVKKNRTIPPCYITRTYRNNF